MATHQDKPLSAPATTGPVVDQKAAADAAAATVARVEETNAQKAKLVDDRSKAMEASNREAMRRMDSARPTPTQRENDLAKLGVATLDKEDHGGEDEEAALRRAMAARFDREPYVTRDLDSKK